MKSRQLKWFTAITLFAALSAPIRLAAQHTRYKVIDLGTFGGPHSYGSVNGEGFQLLNDAGVVSSFADTSSSDPSFPNFCDQLDCFIAHAFRWKNGVLTDLGALPGMTSSAAGSINARGWSAGQSQTSTIDPAIGIPEFRAVVWKQDGIMNLGTLAGGTESLGIYINDSGQVIGFSDNGVPDPFSFPFFFTGTQIHTFLWTNGAIRDIGTLGGPDAVPGTSCSGQPRNVIVGLSYTSFTPNLTTGIPTLDPYIWKNGVMVDLGNLGGTISGVGPNGIAAGPLVPCANNHGQVIGVSNLPGDVMSHAFSWEDGVMTDLGTLGGDNSEAIWLNDAGEVAGSADLPGGQIHHAALWTKGKIHDLGTVAGDPCSRGLAINVRGQVVGGATDCSNFLHAFLWEDGGPMLDLNTLIPPNSGVQLLEAININDRGEILAISVPLGAIPNTDLGRLDLLVPCEAESDEGCGGSPETASTVLPSSSAPVPNHGGLARPAQPSLTPRARAAAMREQMLRRYHLAGLNTPQN